LIAGAEENKWIVKTDFFYQKPLSHGMNDPELIVLASFSKELKKLTNMRINQLFLQ
jgi:hypothetical protein